MVRLKRSEMSVLKNITIKAEGSPETEVWVAVLQTAVFFNSLNPMYDHFYYKNEMVMSKMGINQLRLEVRGVHSLILKFGTKEIMEEFCRSVNYTEGIGPPYPSPASSGTPWPPKSSPSIPSISLSPSLSSP